MHGIEGIVILLVLMGIAGVTIIPVVSMIVAFSIMSRLSNMKDSMDARLSKLERMIDELRCELAGESAGKVKDKASDMTAAAIAASLKAPAQVREVRKDAAPAPKAERTVGFPALPELELGSGIKIVEDASKPEKKPLLPVEDKVSKPAEGKKTEAIHMASEEAVRVRIASAAPKPEFEENALKAIRKMWNWVLYGEESRPQDVTLEYTIASVWLPRIGIMTLLAGIVFGISYSIANNYIGETGRVALSFAAGIGLTLWGMKLAGGKYHAVAQALLGGGMAALYFSSYAAAMKYHLIPSSMAFALMILVTASCCVVSMKLDSLLVALIGAIGGYLTPAMLSTGEKNLAGLFFYMILLGCGILWVARRKDWKILNVLSFLFSCLMYSAALHKFYDKATDYPVAIGFLTASFVLFSFIPIIYNIAHSCKATALELIFMVMNAAAYFCGAYALTHAIYGKEWCAAISLGLAAYHIAQAWWLMRKGGKDKGLLVILFTFAAFFITFSMPLLLSGRWVTTAWSIQALAFLWMSRRIEGNFLKTLAAIVYCVAGVRLLAIDLPVGFGCGLEHYWDEMVPRICTFGSFIGSLAGAWKLLSMPCKADGVKVPAGADTEELLDVGSAGRIFLGAALLILFGYLHFELRSMFALVYPPLVQPVLTTIWVAAIGIALASFLKGGKAGLSTLSAVLAALAIGKLFIFDVNTWSLDMFSMRHGCAGLWEPMLMRALDFLPLIAIFVFGASVCRKRGDARPASIFGTLSLVVLFLYLTMELKTLLGIKLPGFREGGVSVLWGLYALGLLIGGIKSGRKALRYSALALFAVTAFKIFLFDMAHLSQAARIAAFIVLGFVMLGGAFAYVKFKHLFEESPKEGGDK